MRKKEMDVFSLLTEEVNKKADEMITKLLNDNGYSVPDNSPPSFLNHLRREMKAKGEDVEYSCLNNEKGEILLFFELVKRDDTRVRSEVLKLIPRGEYNGENRSSEERPPQTSET